MAEIALTMSGGGYRAAIFHLGTLSYLNHLKLSDGRSMLEEVNILSTISGGTITGLWYMMNLCRGKDVDESIKELYHLLVSSQIVSTALNSMMQSDNKNSSAIKEFIKVYDSIFFHDETFRLIQEGVDRTHVHHFSANGTDFSTGIAFRFQATEELICDNPDFKRGFIGNKPHQVPWNVASDFKLSEILAVSSCFPGGFEPLLFPNDFSIYGKEEHKDYIARQKDHEFILMDGGIVDNQGIEPVQLAETQMEQGKETQDEKFIDLIIVSDVASPRVKAVEVDLPFRFGNMTWKGLNLTLDLFIGVMLGLLWFFKYNAFCAGAVSVLLMIFMGLRVLTLIAKRKIAKWFSKLPFSGEWGNMVRLPFNKMQAMAETRISSLLTLAQGVFMKPIRQMRYNQLYKDEGWYNRLISNNVHELSSKGSYRWKQNYPEHLKPSETMNVNSDKAANMGTTLWFTEKEKVEGVPEALFTAGQYTICMNLLEYMEKIVKDGRNTNVNHRQLLSCMNQLKSDWESFQSNPHFMLSKVL